MADNLDNDTLDNPINAQSENLSDEIIPATDTDTITLNQEIENMEVHHHPDLHHKSKKWKEYFLEFLMIFLAVTMGFFAESYREYLSEQAKEKEYAKTLYTELLSDSVVVSNKLKARLEKEKDIDYLNNFFRDSALNILPKQFYPAFTTSFYLFNTYTFEPKDGILSQLRNSGSLRYFKSFALQKLLGDISVDINNIRNRNEQEYQYFANPLKPFLLKYYDWSWLDQLRKEDTNPTVLEVIKSYNQSNRYISANILNITSFNRGEASNTILFYKQMLLSTRTLQLNNYVATNHKILEFLRQTYKIKNTE